MEDAETPVTQPHAPCVICERLIPFAWFHGYYRFLFHRAVVTTVLGEMGGEGCLGSGRPVVNPIRKGRN